MYNQRQLEITLELFENEGRYMTASSFSEKHHCSLRTIQSDMRLIKDELHGSAAVDFRSMAPKGYCMVCLNRDGFEQLKRKFYQQYTGIAINYQGGNERINLLTMFLLERFRPVPYYEIEEKFYISHSTLLNDLKKAASLLEKYHLELMRSSNKVMVDGSEIDKRRFLLEKQFLASSENLNDENQSGVLDDHNKIRTILVDTFVEFKHTISEVALNNAMIFLSIAKHRMERGFFITKQDFSSIEDINAEYKIAEYAFILMQKRFNLQVPVPEIEYFALYMKGVGNYTAPGVISRQMDDFMLDCLRDIRKTFDIDLTNDMNLRMSLALHCSSLFIRVKYNMQLRDYLADYIQQNYPQGYDIASYMAAVIEKKVGQKLTGEETILAVKYASVTPCEGCVSRNIGIIRAYDSLCVTPCKGCVSRNCLAEEEPRATPCHTLLKWYNMENGTIWRYEDEETITDRC